MFENIANFFRKLMKSEKKEPGSKDAAKERLHLVLMQDRANVSADFLELMKQEIIDVIKKYIEVDEKEIDVRLTNKENEDGTNGAPALYANIPILNIKNEMKKEVMSEKKEEKTEVESNTDESIAHPENEKRIANDVGADESHRPQNEDAAVVPETENIVEASTTSPEETQETENLEEQNVETESNEEGIQENQDNVNPEDEHIESSEIEDPTIYQDYHENNDTVVQSVETATNNTQTF